jgi:hypothetical protein
LDSLYDLSSHVVLNSQRPSEFADDEVIVEAVGGDDSVDVAEESEDVVSIPWWFELAWTSPGWSCKKASQFSQNVPGGQLFPGMGGIGGLSCPIITILTNIVKAHITPIIHTVTKIRTGKGIDFALPPKHSQRRKGKYQENLGWSSLSSSSFS